MRRTLLSCLAALLLAPILAKADDFMAGADVSMLAEVERHGGKFSSAGGKPGDAMQILNRVRLYRRRNGFAQSWLYFAATVLSELSWVARGHRQSRFAVRALLRAASRPPELGCSVHLMPR